MSSAYDTTKTFSYDEAYAAMCMWEEINAPALISAPRPWNAMREEIGTADLRGVVLGLGAACDAAWERTYSKFEADCRSWEHRKAECEVKGEPFFDDGPTDPGDFGWEFVPFWLRNCVDWSDIQNGPRVKGSRS